MHAFETIGNATCLLYENDAPLLATDPWLLGTAYYGSWAHYHAPSEEQRNRCLAAPFVWFSHGHPDHLHLESVCCLTRDVTILIGDHYTSVIRDFLISQGFKNVVVCPDKTWISLSKDVRILCISNMNQDTILVIAAGDTVIINQNDAPLLGEGPFLRKIVRQSKNSYLLALCTNNADMINFVDKDGMRIATDPHARKKGTVMEIGRRCRSLGVANFCCFSSQHTYVRSDSAWANPFHIDWDDMQMYWPNVPARLIEPYVTVDLSDGCITRNHPSQTSDLHGTVSDLCEDDWLERLVATEWSEVTAYFSKLATLRSKVEFIDFVVGGECRRVFEGARCRSKKQGRHRGVVFHVPRASLLKTVRGGYFDDLLIGNFMKTHLINMELYPDFSPRIAKYADNAGVYSNAQLIKFLWHYFRRSPVAMARSFVGKSWYYSVLPRLKEILRTLGLFDFVKKISSHV